MSLIEFPFWPPGHQRLYILQFGRGYVTSKLELRRTSRRIRPSLESRNFWRWTLSPVKARRYPVGCSTVMDGVGGSGAMAPPAPQAAHQVAVSLLYRYISA